MKKLLAVLVLVASVVSAEIPWPEHPRPDWERRDWVNLNGPWKFAFDREDKGVREKWFRAEEGRFDKTILVPFSWGSPASGVKDEADMAWYRREITIPEAWRGKRVFLCVGAADYELAAWVDGMPVGDHKGGYAPIEFELTHVAKFGEKQAVTFRAWDSPDRRGPYLYGKQEYGNVRGIWQTVYLEARPDVYFETVHFTPDIDRGTVRADVTLASPAKRAMRAYFDFKKDDYPNFVSVTIPAGEMEASCEIALTNVKLWDLDNPYLYDVGLRLTGAEQEDHVKTYFGMRKISAMTLPGTDCRWVSINNKPHYLRLCLDQAFDPQSYYTYPNDAFVKNDILISKRLGLSGNRIHIKMEVPRRLYWADKLGLLIMADVPHCWNSPAGSMQEYFEHHERTLRAMIKRDYNHPAIFSWVLFNETWGLFTRWDRTKDHAYLPETQRRVAAAWLTTKKLDKTRLVEDQSACNHDHVITDLGSWHGYLPGFRWEEEVAAWCRDTFAGSRNNYIGGHVQRHEVMLNSECGNVWGYHGATGCIDQSWDYHQMMNAFRRNPRCAGFLYTEHHDVSTEWNGYVRDDRSPKFSGVDELFPGMTFADFHRDAYISLDPEICKVAEAGAKWTMPVDLSLATDAYAGAKTFTLAHRLRYWNAAGQLVEGEEVADGSFNLKPWQHGRLAQVTVELPRETAAGVVCFTLAADGEPIARNFACYVTRGAALERTATVAPGAYTKAEWSVKTWKIFDGLKVDGTGDGFFEYTFDVPAEAKGATFRAELSTKRLYAKDVRDDADKHGLQETDKFNQYVRRSANPNASPMTSTDVWPGAVKVYANGELVKTVPLANDPADHRGILSWAAQKKDGRLHEAGTYGWPVEVEIPAAVRAKGKDGKLVIRLEAVDGKGLAVYGASFGRIPSDPCVVY